MPDQAAAIREELGRILASGPFVASPMLANFLRYVVEETLAGRGDRLKAYTIAVGALGRSDDFDPNDNPLVRVQARRLRQALARFYEVAGPAGPVCIVLPLGSYVPTFPAMPPSAAPSTAAEPDPADAEPLPTGDSPPALAPTRPGRRLAGPLAALAVVLIVGLAVFGRVVWNGWLSPPSPAAPSAETGAAAPTPEATAPVRSIRNLDASRILPLLGIDVEVRDPAAVGFDAEIYRNRLETFAQRFENTVVLTRRSSDFPAPAGQPLYLLKFLVARESEAISVYFRLVHAGDDRVVRSGAISFRNGLPPFLDGGRAQTAPDLVLLRDLLQLNGAVLRDLLGLDDLSVELACLSRAWQNLAEPTEAGRSAARACLAAVVADDPRLVPALVMDAVIALDDYTRAEAPAPPAVLKRAEVDLVRATQIAPTASAAFHVLGNLLLLRGDIQAAIVAARHAVELSPDDVLARAGYGSILARIGRSQEALDLLSEAADALVAPPRWLRFYLFVALNDLGRPEEADRQIALFDGTTSPLHLVAVAIRAHRRGDPAAAGAALRQIVRAEPDFSRDPADFLRRRGFVDPVTSRLVVDLQRIGIPRP